MTSERRIALGSLVGLFVVLTGVIIWASVHESQTHFLAGTKPDIAEPAPPEPKLPPVRPNDPARGSSDKAAVQIVEFADFTCLYCRLMEFDLEQTLTNTTIPVRLVWRDLPLQTEQREGLIAAVAARCAGEQNKFWPLHDALMKADRLDLPSIKTLAQGVGVEPVAFDQCVSAGKYLTAIQQDVALARANGITGAPTLFIGKTVLSGYTNAAELEAAIQHEAPR
jgi:protein-disulfide isomerase